MAIEVIGDLDLVKDLEQRLSTIETELSKSLQIETGKMKERIRSGRDVDNKQMTLSADYQQAKIRSGRNGIADLTWTGTLLNSITTKVEKVGNNIVGTIFFLSTTAPAPKIKPKTKRKTKATQSRQVKTLDKARGLIDQGKNFFGLTDEQVTNIKNKIKEALLG